MGEGSGLYRVSMGKLSGTDHLGDLGVDGMVILRWIPGSGRWGNGPNRAASG